jgi:hypothetical protein
MITKSIEIYQLSEKEPPDDKIIMVKRAGQCFAQLVYNSYHKCWDDETGDDYAHNLNRDDYWFAVPSVP